MLRIRILHSGQFSAIRRVASTPFILGLAISMLTRLGLRSRASLTVSSPLPASPITSISGCWFRISLNPCRTTAWSSANRIRNFRDIRRLFVGNLYGNLHASAGAGLHVDPSAGRSGARSHADQAETGMICFLHNSPAVVGNGEPEHAFGRDELYLYLGGLRMTGNVSQRFLGDAKQLSFAFVTKPAAERSIQLDGNPGSLRKPIRQPAQARVQSEIIQDAGSKKLGYLANVLDSVL